MSETQPSMRLRWYKLPEGIMVSIAALLFFTLGALLACASATLQALHRAYTHLFTRHPVSEPKPRPNDDLKGAVAIVTGANAGIGLSVSTELARRGATVIMACRSLDKAHAAKRALPLSEEAAARLVPMRCDLSDLYSVLEFAQAFGTQRFRLDALICNAGVPPGLKQPTAQGFEQAFGVSFVAHYVLVRLLLPLLRKTTASRVVIVSSVTHWWSQHPLEADWDAAAFDRYSLFSQFVRGHDSYGDAKQAAILLAVALRSRGIPASAADPGAVRSDIWRYLPAAVRSLLDIPMRLAFLTPEQGSSSILHAAFAPSLPLALYFVNYHNVAALPPMQAIGLFAGVARSALSKPELLHSAKQVGLASERLWRWAESEVTRVSPKVSQLMHS